MPGKIVVTAGPTREKIDAIRFISNRSSGKMGYAIAEAARDAGYDCVLISGPVNLPPPAGIRLVAVESVAQMQEAVQREIQDANALIMAAAPADYRPADVIEGKMKKKDGDLSLRLERTPDILLGIGQNKPEKLLLIGFAAESSDLHRYALDKLQRKNLDWICANDIGNGDRAFGADRNTITMFGKNGEVILLPDAPKHEIARSILRVTRLVF